MFPEGMLRPSRRHAHERISQQEDASNDSNNNGGGIAANISADPSPGPAIVVLGGDGIGDDQQRDLNATEEVALSDDGVDEGDASQPSTAPGLNQDADAGEPSTAGENQNESSERRGRDVDNEPSSDEEEGDGPRHDPATHPFLASHIQTERELRYRRQSTCTLLILFFLIRLWIEAIVKKDVGLIFLSMMGTTWTYRWFVSRREAEEEHDRQIAEAERNAGGEGLANREEGSGADAAVEFDPDLGLMSFQAQLALAILESQRQMFENGGYGGNDRAGNSEGPGVTDEAKGRWKKYEWGENAEDMANLTGLTRCSSATGIKRSTSNESNYGSVSTALTEDEERYDEGLEKSPKLEEGLLPKGLEEDELPSCSICLCEYEPGEKVIRLPCDHLFHESCLDSWTEHHVRCPLCNSDLMEGFQQPPHVQRAQLHAEEQRAFRNMALSTLGRRIRTRRAGGRRNAAGGGARGGPSSAAALVAAAEDSIV